MKIAIKDRLPKESDGNHNGEVMAYKGREYFPVPIYAVSEPFTHWRRIVLSDYAEGVRELFINETPAPQTQNTR